MMRVLIIIITILAASCQRAASVGSSSNKDGCMENTTGDYTLCTNQITSGKSTIPGFNYVLYNESKDVVVEGTITSGRVQWIDNYAIEIYETPGNITSELSKEDITRVYLIKKKEFITKTEFLKSK